MEYLVAILTFGIGWILAKMDNRVSSRGKLSTSKQRELAAEAFQIGVKYGATQALKHMDKESEENKTPMGFNLNMNKD